MEREGGEGENEREWRAGRGGAKGCVHLSSEGLAVRSKDSGTIVF